MRGGYHLIYGATGSGKTFYALDRSLRVAAQGGRCIYIATEGVYAIIVRRQAWEHHHQQRPDTWHRLDLPEGLDLANAFQVDELLGALAGLEIDLITIDTLREAHRGDENSSQDGAAINAAVQRLIRETGAAVDVVHHSGVNEGRERGSTAIAANCDLKWKVTGDDSAVTVTNEKNRLGALFTPRNYRITPTPAVVDGAVLLPASSASFRDAGPLTAGMRAILDALALSIFSDSGAKTAQLEAATGLKGGSLFRALSALKNRGYIAHEGKGDPYTITSAGRAAIGPNYQPAAPQSPASTTSYSASDSTTTTSTSHLPASTTVVPASSDDLPTTTTTPRGGSGGRWEQAGEGIEIEPPPGRPAPAARGQVAPVLRHPDGQDAEDGPLPDDGWEEV